MENIHWKEFGLLLFVWVAFLVLQVTKVRISAKRLQFKTVDYRHEPHLSGSCVNSDNFFFASTFYLCKFRKFLVSFEPLMVPC
jgi:hypothetical protein